ncbi:MAG: hypothetical protein ACR2K1_01630 [Saprospiraceae bacterium]
MKKIALVCCFIGFALLTRAQDTAIIVTSEIRDEWTPTALVDARSRLFRLQEPVRAMLKINLITQLVVGAVDQNGQLGIRPLVGGINLDVGAERKIAPAFSVDAGMRLQVFTPGAFSPISASQRRWFGYVQARLEPRWYYQMRRQIREGVQADNLSGNYLGLELSSSWFRGQPGSYQMGLALNYGIQRRLFGWGYFDLGYGLGFARAPQSAFSRGGSVLFTRPRLRLGLVRVRPQPGAAPDAYCEALRCFREERQLWKTDLLNLFDLYADSRSQALTIRPYVAYERKIGVSPFSVNTELFGQAGLGRYTFGDAFSKNYGYRFASAGLQVQPRWYFNLKHRIALGRSGNNLSGMYLGLQVGGTLTRSEVSPILQTAGNRRAAYLGAAQVFGVQYRFLRTGFADLQLKVGYGATYYTDTQLNGEQTRGRNPGELLTGLELRVGRTF